MSRIERIGNNVTLYLGDCRDILPQLKADAVITDPPYGIFKKTGNNGNMFGKDTIYSVDDTAARWDIRPSKELLDLCISVAPYFIIWGGNYLAGHLGECRGPLVWNKQTGNNSYADGEIAWSNVTGTCRIITHQWCGAFKDSERGQRAVHPTQKPVAVMQWCIDFIDGNIILDPFMGSGTTGVAAVKMGRQFIGIEAEVKYFEIALRRIEEATHQPDMFIDRDPIASTIPELLL